MTDEERDPFEEPCLLTPDDDESMLDPVVEQPVGPSWWEGRWPAGGIRSMEDLERWVDDRLNEMIGMNRAYPSLGNIARMIGHQAVTNASRYLARNGTGDHPPRPRAEELDRFEAIETALETILRYLRQKLPTGTIESAEHARPLIDAGPATQRGKPKSGDRSQKRSWTQRDLDEAIRKYKAERASTYADLVEGVRAGKPGAIKSARKTYGRNVLVRHFGVKSPDMVTKSPVWRQIADELRLVEPSARPSKSRKVGYDFALEEKAGEGGGNVLDTLVNRETIALIKKVMPAEAVDGMIKMLETGEWTDERAREIVEMYREQQKDAKSRKVHTDD